MNDPAIVQDDREVGITDGLDTVGNGDDGAVLQLFPQHLLDVEGCLLIDRRRSLVSKEEEY